MAVIGHRLRPPAIRRLVTIIVDAKEPQLALAFFLLASAAILLTRLNGGIALLWLANAPLIAYLCRTKPRRWPSALIWAAGASVAASTLFGPVLWAAPVLGLASVFEAVVAALLLRRVLPGCDYFVSSASVVMFSGIAGLAAPLVSGLIGATMAWLAFGRPWTPTYLDWVVGHGLGTLILSPVIALFQDESRNRGSMLRGLWGEGGFLLVAVTATTAAVFLQEQLPLLFLPALPILLATFKLGQRGAAMSIAIVAIIGWIATGNGYGPVMMTDLSSAGQFQFFQFYLAATFLMSLPVAGALEQREQLLLAIETSEARHRRIVDRSQDVIFETDAQDRWTFLSDAWLRLTGHDVESSLGQSATRSISPECWAELKATARGMSNSESRIAHAEVRLLCSEAVQWIAVDLGMLRDGAGAVVGGYGTIRDVTQRRQAEAEVAESERRYRLLADNTSDMIARVGTDGLFLSATPASRQLLGRSPSELVGTRAMDLVFAEDAPGVVAAYTALLDGAPDQTCTYRHHRQGGDLLWVESVLRLIRDDQGQPCEFIVSVRDASHRKLLEAEAAAALQQFRESNRLFGMAGSIASIGHWRFEVDSGSVIWSDEVFRIHGLDVGSPPPIDRALDFYHPDDRERVSALLSDAVNAERGFEWEARLIRPDGSVRNVVAQGQVELDDSGQMAAMFGVFQDVTDRALAEATLRESEARFRLITEQASDIIALIDMDGTCLFMSPASTSILGTDPADMIGTRPIERVHEDDLALVLGYSSHLRKADDLPNRSLRFRLRRADGAYAWLEASSRLAEINRNPCVVSVWRDVSQQVAIEAELKAAKAAAEAASIAKAGFLANMSHEIRTPMNGVIGFAELLLASDLSPRQRRDAGLIVDSGKAMMKLLNDILDLSKIEAGQLDVVSEPFDLPHAVRACGKLLEPGAAKKHLRFDVAVADDVPRFVRGDGLRLRQIVLNLVGNAIKFTEHGSVSLEVRLTEESGQQWLAIGVRDTGIGIAPERQRSIFEEFVQADHSITRRYGGTGLGLAISNRLATLMGGRILLESAVGMGTVVTILLPATVADVPADHRPAALNVIAASTRTPCRILLAEDHEVNQLLVQAMLAGDGHEVVLVENGQAAVEAVRNSIDQDNPFDLTFMDMQMPVMDGLAATRAIRLLERPGDRRLPIVALTANAFAADLESCRQAGMDDHVAKPVSIDVLLGAVARWSSPAAPRPSARTKTTSGFQPSPALRGKYAEHRSRTLEQVDALVRRGTFTEQELQSVAELLHKLAGTAGMFGEASLGDHASALEAELLNGPQEDVETRIAAAVASLRQAA